MLASVSLALDHDLQLCGVISTATSSNSPHAAPTESAASGVRFFARIRTAAKDATGGGFHLTALQALTRLVNLRRRLGVDPDGTDELAAVYERFTDGFSEQDLFMAKALLN